MIKEMVIGNMIVIDFKYISNSQWLNMRQNLLKASNFKRYVIIHTNLKDVSATLHAIASF